MCGLIGTAGSLDFDDREVIKKMLLFDYFRGQDATGIAVVNRHVNKVDVFKRAVDPITAFQMKSFEDILKTLTASAIIGHNRAATRGDKSCHANAHPFKHKHITGAHNGTLSLKSFTTLKEMIERPDVEVDSEAIFIAIAEYGEEAVVPLLQGAWALTWYDSEKNSLKWLRNDLRPFWFAYSKNLKKIYWASEWSIIDAATSIGDGSVFPKVGPLELYADDAGLSFWETKPDVLYEWPLEEVMLKGFSKVAAIKTEMKGAEPEPPTTTSYYSGPYGGGDKEDPFGRNTKESTKGSCTTLTTTTNQQQTQSGKTTHYKTGSNITVCLNSSEEDPLAGFMSKEEFDQLAANGCSWCGSDVSYRDVGIAIYEKTFTVLCPDCCNSSEGEQARILVDDIQKYI